MGSNGPGNGDPLLLAAGHLHRLMLDAAQQTHSFQRFHCQLPALIGADSLIDQGELHIFQHRQALDQIILLKDEADLPVADAGEFPIGEFPYIGSVQIVLSMGGDVQTPQYVHHGGLAGTGLSHHRHELSAVNGQAHTVQGADLALQTFTIDLVDVFDLNQHGDHLTRFRWWGRW